MRLLYDHTIFVTQKYGGISRYFAELIARVIRNEETRVQLHMGLYINGYGLEKLRPAFDRFRGVRRPAIPRTGTVAVRVSDWLFQGFMRGVRADVYHATKYFVKLPRFHARQVITVHDMIPEMVGKLDANQLSDRHRAIRAADRVICVSERTKQDMQQLLGIPDRKIDVVYHGSSLSPGHQGPRRVREPYILHVGATNGYKNLEIVLRALAAAPDVSRCFRLVCFGVNQLDDVARKIIAAGRLEGRVTLLGGGDDVLANLYTYASALVYPSLFEGFGIPLLEAMTLGCPVLSSNSSCLPEIGGDGVMYFDPTDADDLVAKLRHILGDERARQALIDRGRRRATIFSWERCARETLASYRA